MITPEQRVWRVIEDWVEGYEMRACVTDFMQNQLVEQILTATEPEDECICCSRVDDYMVTPNPDCPLHGGLHGKNPYKED